MICVVVLCRVPRRSPPPIQVNDVAAQPLEEVGHRLGQPRLRRARLRCARALRPRQLRRRLQHTEWSAVVGEGNTSPWSVALCILRCC